VQRIVWALVAVLIAKRIGYHLLYLVRDPFALGTIADGQLYELAARDLLSHPPLGSEPFYLQGLYAYLLALPMAAAPQIVLGLLLQLVIAALALLLFQRSARTMFGPVLGGLSLCVLLASPELSFYENKYLSVSLGVATNIFALFAALRAFEGLRARDLALAGFAMGLSLLGRPNMVLAVPFSLVAFGLLARAAGTPLAKVIAPLALGLVLAVAPMALRNQLVIGAPDVFPSHGGGIPLFIGNNPHADGGWNTGGGLLTGMVYIEAQELGRKLGIEAETRAELDRKVGAAMADKAIDFIVDNPGRFIELCALKVFRMLGNHRFVRDYDIRGESELIGGYHEWGSPFGVLLGLGVVGFAALLGRARATVDVERARWIALLFVLGGQLVAIAVANVLIFTSAQNRVPLVVPLTFVAGPALEALYALGKRLPARFAVGRIAVVIGVLACAQAFWPRTVTAKRPSSVHYYNLATVEERLDRLEDAERHYRAAKEKSGKKPMYWLSHGLLLRRLGRDGEARASFNHLVQMPSVPPDVLAYAQREIERIDRAAGTL
jgi:tetratricopeptide (TPR) repeat protein